jgi:hypothetical protein
MRRRGMPGSECMPIPRGQAPAVRRRRLAERGLLPGVRRAGALRKGCPSGGRRPPEPVSGGLPAGRTPQVYWRPPAAAGAGPTCSYRAEGGVTLFCRVGLLTEFKSLSSWHRREALRCRAAVPSFATIMDFKSGGPMGGAEACAELRQKGVVLSRGTF